MTTPAPSLRRRLFWVLLSTLAAFWLAAMAVVWLVVRHEVEELLDEHQAQLAAALVSAVAGAAAQGLPEAPVPFGLRDGAGRLVAASPGFDEAMLAAAPPEGFGTAPGHRVLAVPVGDGSLLVAEPLEERRDAATETARALLAPLLLLVPASLALALALVARALAPLGRLRRAIEARDAGHLSPLGLSGLPKELAALSEAADALLARVRRAIAAERAFTADAAHELRTPIAAALAQCQRLAAELPPGPGATRARQVEAEVRRVARLAAKLLDLARAEGGGVLAAEAADPVPVLRAVVEDLRRAGGGDRIALGLPEGGAAPSPLDPDAFASLARNLIENGLRHGPPGAPVEVALDVSGRLRVTNGGPVVPPERLSTLTRRFARAGPRGEGAGLGLAIAAAVARGAGGRLDLRSPAQGRPDGFEAIFAPPLAGQVPVRSEA